MERRVEASVLVQKFFPESLRLESTSVQSALDLLNTPPVEVGEQHGKSRLDQIVGYLKPEKVEIIPEENKIRMDFTPERYDQIKDWF